MAKSRFRPHDPEAVHRRFEEIRSRVTRRMDDEWQRLTRSTPRENEPRPQRAIARRRD